jgi:IclR family pca regulon transcriptional regulator
LDGDELVYVERIRTSQIITINMHVGTRLPLYNTSLGRALICEMPEEWLSEYMTRLKSDSSAQDYLRKKGLLKLLQETRTLGYALNDEELVKGLRSVASPIRGASKEIVGAINIAVPSSRVTAADLKRNYVPELLSTAEKISMALGYRSNK